MLRLAMLVLTTLYLDAGNGQNVLPKEPNVLTPPYFNIATGKKIEATATCGEEVPQVFCKLTGGPNDYDYHKNLHQGQFCDVCDIDNPTKSHPIKYAIDGTEKWWQSPPLSQGSEFNKINITIHLGQVFHVAYAIIKFANSPRAGTWVLERSSDHGKTFQPWQYFANSDSDCHNHFGIDAFEEISSDDSVICTSEYSDVVPLERGEVIVSIINRRPGGKNFSHSPILQEWSKATDVRLRLLRTKTLLGHLMAVQRQDPTVTRRYFYSIKDISIGGRCVCNGHADTCLPDPLDRYKLKCECRHNTCGDSCEYCCPGFVQKAWRAAVPESANECEPCNCHGHSTECVYDEQVAIRRQSLDLSQNYEGGGVCQNCAHNTAGINCEKCIDGYYRPANVDPSDPNGCRPFPDWLTFYGPRLHAGLDIYPPSRSPSGSPSASPKFDIGRPNERPYPMDRQPLDSSRREGSTADYWFDKDGNPHSTLDLDPDLLDGFRPRACDCDSAFTVGTCEPVTGRCYCKPKYAGDRCDRCAPGYHKFPECEPCPCYYNATRDGICLPLDDVCPCKYNFAGKYCSECAAGFYNFPECTPCTCLGQGAISDICDPYTGQCTCDEGFGGLYCDQCSPGYYNYPVCQTCSCYTAFTTEQVCDPDSGRCFCTELVTGESCNQCKPGYFDFPQCRECECSSPGSASSLCDAESGKCQCKPNFQGPKCEECAPEYYNYPNCIPCDCDVQGSQRTTCDAETGQCTCFSYIGGRRCDQCTPDYFNFPRCEDCKCNPLGIESVVPGVCLAFTIGQCDCKENVVGKYCDMCSPLHYNLTLGCIDCNCFLQGTLDGVAACDTEDGGCWCKPYTCTQRCSQCEDGFFGLEESNYFGCSGCQCDAGGALSEECDSVDGQCQCKIGVKGRKCDNVSEGFYYPTLLQHQFEVEDGKTSEGQILRFGFSEEKFPSFSMKGYGEFSIVQPKAILDVTITQNSLYKVLIYFVNPRPWTLSSTITFAPKTKTESDEFDTDEESPCPNCSEQEFKVEFEQSSVPALLTANNVFVLNRGQWNMIIEGDPGLLIDYVVLLPSEYYEPSILQASVTKPCKPTLTPTGMECLMYEHPSLKHTPHAVLTHFTDKAQHDSPTTAHPTMVLLDGNSVNNDHKRMSVTLNGVHRPGKYVLVLIYASTEDRMQTVEARVTDGAGREFDNVKFNIYSCEYSFLCRQVALTPLSDVMVVDVSVPTIKVDLSVDAGEVVYVRGIHAIPYEQWTMEYTEPKRKCITKEGPEFEECIDWGYLIPQTARKFDIRGGEEDPAVPTATDADTDAKYLGGGNNTITIDMDLQPGRYVFLLHYFNPHHLSFSPNVVISDGLVHEGSANVTYCPSADGCRGVVTTNTGAVVIDITSPAQTMTITVPKERSFWLDYVLAIPEASHNADHLDVAPIDRSRKFFDECYGVGTEGLIDSSKTPSEFCRTAVFSLTMDFNDGALPCDCSGAGTTGGGDVDCNDFGGQCPCKPNVIGRKCDRCMTGYYGYPDCKPCDCNGALCDEINGDCICPPNTVTPGCDQCQPFTHSFHPLAGCVACDCHQDGVENAADLGCSRENGQCRCKENVEGQRCDKCKPGFFGFPECRPCVCDERGRVSEGCDPVSGQCLCKENVEGQQCDRCKPGTFYLDINNPRGCTKCFCFGASLDCSSTQYPLREIIDMDGWRLLNLKTDQPEVRRQGQTAMVDIVANGGALDPTRANLFWAAPKTYLKDQIGSYGGTLHFVTESEKVDTSDEGGRGDSTITSASDKPAPLTASAPTVILEGNGMLIGWTNRDKQGSYSEISLQLVETHFVHQATGNPVSREEMMMVLGPLSSLRIHASDDPDAEFVSISDVSMTTTNYDDERGSGETIPTVEECICPQGYTGQSCQMCDRGHFRENRGPYLGYCAECDCYGHCDTCDESGQLLDKEDCKHHTAGDNCEKCEDGYIGNATSKDPDACQPCPCPYPSAEGNFATKCEYDQDGDVICYCQDGYTGEKCDQCSLGFFGNPSVIGGDCKACNCHGNLDNNLVMETCDPFTGQCSGCQYDTGGKYCERCADGYFGDARIAKNCTKCPCDECGTLQCDYDYGFCACKAHVIGVSCDQCEPGYWNLESCSGCQDCKCGIGARNDECNPFTGKCECAPNVIGQKCDRCAPGHWEYSSMGCKPCNCRNNGDCNPVNGECKCPPGITGPQCDQCKLERQVLPPGGLECESCDTCSHDLLDAIEPMTKRVRGSSEQLSKVSVGVAAAKRLEKLVDRTNQASDAMDEAAQNMNQVESDADKLLNSEMNDLNMMLMGSGDEVEAMCNESQAVLDATEKTNQRMTKLDANSTDINDEINTLNVDSKDLLEKIPDMYMGEGSGSELEVEASGDSDEYLQKLANAKMLLERMQMRIFEPMKEIADEELALAEELFSLVNTNFTLPADDLEQTVDKVTQDLSDKLTKMKELRKRLNNATNTVTEVATLNAANSKALTAATDAVNKIVIEWAEIDEIMRDSQGLLERGGSSSDLAVLDTEALKQATAELQLVYDMYVEGLEGMEALVNMSIEKANMLKNDAGQLAQLVEETKDDPRNVRAVEAANRYQTIINTMQEARDAADEADLDATEALGDVAVRNLGEAADRANAESGELLNEVQDILNNNIGSLQRDLDAAKDGANAMSGAVDGLTQRLEEINNGINNLDQGDIDANIESSKKAAAEANAITDEVLRAAEQLKEQIDGAPDPNLPINEELAAVEEILDELDEDINEAHDQVTKLKEKSKKMMALPGQLGLDDKIQQIRKMIELSRSRADSVKVSMEFKVKSLRDGIYPEYAQVHIPRQSFDLDDSLQIDMYVNVSKSADNSLLYLGDTSTDTGDYVALETIGGQVYYYYKVGAGVGELRSDEPINDDKWHHIIIRRDGNEFTLEVEYYLKDEGRGDSLESDSTNYEDKTGQLEGENLKAMLPMSSTPFILGGMPLEPRPTKLKNNQMNGCINNVKVNGESVGLWNFVSYNGPQPGRTCPSSIGRISGGRWWRFRGIDSYIRVTGEQLKQTNVYDDNFGITYCGFKFITRQQDGLLFFMGESEKQFIALEILGGKLAFTCNYGWDKPRHAVSKSRIPDVSAVGQQLSVKFGVVNRPELRMIALLINNELAINITFNDWNPQIRGDVWFGGIHRNELRSEFTPYVTQIGTNYRGCIKDLVFHIRVSFSIYEADERVGVTPGCDRESVPRIETTENEYITIAEHYPYVGLTDNYTEEATVVIPELVVPEEEPVVETVKPPALDEYDYEDDDTEDQRLIFVDNADDIISKSDEKSGGPELEIMGRSGATYKEKSDVAMNAPTENEEPTVDQDSKMMKESRTEVEEPSKNDMNVADPQINSPSEAVLEEEEKIVVINIEEETKVIEKEEAAIDVEGDKVDVELEEEEEMISDKSNGEESMEPGVEDSPIVVVATNATKPPPPGEEEVGEMIDSPVIDLEESAQVGRREGDNFAEEEGGSAASVLPAILIIMGVIVGVVLLAAVVSAIMKGSLFGGGAGPTPSNPPPLPMEQAPLNDVQAQRVAQMDW